MWIGYLNIRKSNLLLAQSFQHHYPLGSQNHIPQNGHPHQSGSISLKYQYFAPSGIIFNGMIKIGVFLENITRQWFNFFIDSS